MKFSWKSTHKMGSKLEQVESYARGLFNSIKTCTLILCWSIFMKKKLTYKELMNLRLFYYTNLKIKNKLEFFHMC